MSSLLQQQYNWLKSAAQLAVAELCEGPGCGECRWRDLCDECSYYDEDVGSSYGWRDDEVDEAVADDRLNRRAEVGL